MVTQDAAEKEIKAGQKAFLLAMETHPVINRLSDDTMNAIRRRVFRATFAAFRLGLLGLRDTAVHPVFVGFLDDLGADIEDATVRSEQAELCLRTTLDAFRTGALYRATRDQSTPEA